MSTDSAIGLQEPVPSVASDLLCIGCGYNIRTLAETAVCPECARPVTDSLRFPHLHLADVDWLRRLRRGTVLMAVAASLMAVLLSTLFVLEVTGVQSGLTTQAVLIATAILMSISWTGGIWLGTTSEPAASIDNRRPLSRWANRILAINSPILASVLAGIAVLQTMQPAWRRPNWVVMVTFIGMYVLAFTCPMLACLHFRAIDRRAHRPGLRRINAAIAALMAISLGLYLTGVTAQLAFRVNLSPGMILLAMFCCYVAAFVLGAFGFVGHWRLFTQAMGNRGGMSP